MAPLLLSIVLQSSPSRAGDYYACDCGAGAEVGCTNGNNANTGASAAKPWRTYDRFQDAIATSACGDTFNFCKGGDFVVSGTTEWTVAGQDCSADPRIIGAYQPGAFDNNPVVRASGSTFNFGATGARGVTLRDIDLVCSGLCNSGVGTVLAGVTDVRLERVLVDGFNVGVQVASEVKIEIVKSTIQNNKNQGVIGQAGTGTLIEGSLFKNNGCLTGTADDCGLQHALYFNNLTASNSRVVVVRNNTFDANCVDAHAGRNACNGNVVAIRGGTGVSVTDNIFLSPLSPEAMAGCSVVRMAASTDPNQVCTSCEFSRNRVIGGHGLFEFESWMGGVIENNVFYTPTSMGVAAAKSAISHQPSGSGARPSVHPIIRNNSIVVGSSAGAFPAVGLDLRENAGTTRVYSNAIRMLGTGTNDACFRLFSAIGVANVSEDYNLCERVNVSASWASYPAPRTLAQYQTDSANGDHSKEADPGFVNPPDDFCLAPGSPGIDAGDPVNSAPDDLLTAVRPAGAAPDVGAFEYRGALGGADR